LVVVAVVAVEMIQIMRKVEVVVVLVAQSGWWHRPSKSQEQ